MALPLAIAYVNQGIMVTRKVVVVINANRELTKPIMQILIVLTVLQIQTRKVWPHQVSMSALATPGFHRYQALPHLNVRSVVRENIRWILMLRVIIVQVGKHQMQISRREF